MIVLFISVQGGSEIQALTFESNRGEHSDSILGFQV